MKYFLLLISIPLLFVLPYFVLSFYSITFIWFFEFNFLIWFLLLELVVYGYPYLYLLFVGYVIVKFQRKFFGDSRSIPILHSIIFFLGTLNWLWVSIESGQSEWLDPRIYWEYNWFKTLLSYPQYIFILIYSTYFPIYLIYSNPSDEPY